MYRVQSFSIAVIGRSAVGRLRAVSTSTALQEANQASGSTPKPSAGEEGIEREVKVGVNAPRSAGEFARETKNAAVGLAESIEMGFKSVANAARTAVGMTDGEKPLSNDAIHGAAGKMEHATPGSTTGGPATDRAHAEAKYVDMMSTEKPQFPHGEQSVNEQFPEMAEAARLQSSKEGDQAEHNRELREDMSGCLGKNGNEESLQANLHSKGP